MLISMKFWGNSGLVAGSVVLHAWGIFFCGLASSRTKRRDRQAMILMSMRRKSLHLLWDTQKAHSRLSMRANDLLRRQEYLSGISLDIRGEGRGAFLRRWSPRIKHATGPIVFAHGACFISITRSVEIL
jgi:hypothetical protein